MKSLKSKVILSAVVLIFALVATIGSTFAWFTVSNTVSTSDITLNVTTADSLLIKIAPTGTAIDAVANGADLDPSTYTTSITGAQLISAGYLLSTWTMNPATTVIPDYSASVANTLHTIGATTERVLSSTTSYNSATGFAIQLKFWVMAQATNDLRLNMFSVTGDSGTATIDDAVEQSLRLAVTSRNNTTGVLYGNDIDYLFTFAGTSLAASAPITGTNFNTVLEKNASFTPVTPGTAGPEASSGSVIQSLGANVPVVVFVTFFIDGWDSDATNYIIGAPMTVEFEFTIA